MDINDEITAIIKAEGREKTTNDPNDAGGRTQYGISEKSNPEAWADGKVTEEEARAIYLKKYVTGPRFDRVADSRLQHFLVDFGVTSGPSIAIQYLQRSLGLPDDGIIGPHTIGAINNCDPKQLLNRLVIERAKMIGRIVHKNPSQVKFLNGWLNRVFEFFVP
jgi:lysozyme family protein